MVQQLKPDEIREKLKSFPLVIIDFSATWCGPCKIQGKIMEEVVDKLKEEKLDEFACVYKIDVDECEDIANGLKIRSIPTIMFFRDGKIVVFPVRNAKGDVVEIDRFVGVRNTDYIMNFVKAIHSMK